MRVLVLGAAGMLGHKLVQRLSTTCDVWATLRAPKRSFLRYGLIDAQRLIDGIDVTNWDAIVGVMAAVRPDAVINCVGIIKQLPTAHDPVTSLRVNSLLPHRLQRLGVAAGARLVHVSTDCVFSGRKGMYTEQDESDALDLYGRTKFLGETAGPGALTIRTSIIGRELASASGLVEWLLSQRGRTVKGYRRAIYSGFTTDVLCRIVLSVLERHPDLHGTIHVSSEPINKYDLLLLIRDAYKLDVEIAPDDEVTIDRSLDSARFRTLTGFVPPSWADMVAEMAADRTPYGRWRAE